MRNAYFLLGVGFLIIFGVSYFFLPRYTAEVLTLSSPAFSEGASIPAKYTCDGENISPSLSISGVPSQAKSLALIMDDPDATGGVVWDHWIAWNISPDTIVISENTPPEGAREGTTSFGDQKYGGPCPPQGAAPHRYFFKLYALDTELNLPRDTTKKDLESAMEEHIVEKVELMGRYQRINIQN